MQDDEDRIIGNILKASDPANAYDYEQTQTAKYNIPGEKKLLMALLEDAFLTLGGRTVAGLEGSRQGKARREALEWVERDDDSPFSFIDTCHELGFDCGQVRAKARDAYQSKQKKYRHTNRVK